MTTYELVVDMLRGCGADEEMICDFEQGCAEHSISSTLCVMRAAKGMTVEDVATGMGGCPVEVVQGIEVAPNSQQDPLAVAHYIITVEAFV